MRNLPLSLFGLLAFLAPVILNAGPIVADFEGLPDSTILTNQYSGVIFSNAIILTAGISLNEFEFPPRSGVNVASDNGGPMSITFSTPVQSFGGYFTYAEPLTLDAFGIGNTLLTSVTSTFSDNEALSGVPGSSPDELLQVSSSGGISRVTIAGDPAGGSFALDDAAYGANSAAVPEPSSWCLVIRHHDSNNHAAEGAVMMAYRLSLVFGLLALPFHAAAPAVGLVRATPMTAIIGSPTQITVTASISDPSLIPASVDLLRLNADGTTTILGTLHDDGLNGDAFAGDLVFSLLVTLNAPTVSQIQLQVSAAFKGVLLRAKSPNMNVFFQAANAPQQSIAALALNLAAGNITAALNSVVPSNKTTNAFNTLNQQGLNALASMLQAGVLVSSHNDLRVFQAPFVTPNGTTTTVEFTMVPGPNGRWLINSW